MTTTQDVAVTYTGTDNPFKDRIYRTGLTFTPGQTRLVPLTLAQRFLRHSDVFKEGEAAKPKAAKVADDQGKQPEQTQQPDAQAATSTSTSTSTSTEQPKDDTKQVLEQQKQEQDVQRQQEDARFALLDSIDSMKREAVIEWAEQHYGQKIPGNVSVAKARDMARGFIDQYGMPA